MVSRTCRVVRVSSRTPSPASSEAMRRVTSAGEMRSSLAASAKLDRRATRLNVRSSSTDGSISRFNDVWNAATTATCQVKLGHHHQIRIRPHDRRRHQRDGRFYELVTNRTADWLAPQFAEIVTPAATLAIGSAETVAVFAEGSAKPGANRTAILKFMVEDIDAAFERLKDKVELVQRPNCCLGAIARSSSAIPRALPSASSCRSPMPRKHVSASARLFADCAFGGKGLRKSVTKEPVPECRAKRNGSDGTNADRWLCGGVDPWPAVRGVTAAAQLRSFVQPRQRR